MRPLDHDARRQLIRHWIPQGLRDIYNTATGHAIRFHGIHADWGAAKRAAAGYADDTLFQRIEAAALAVRNGEAAWEQDGVTHAAIPPDWPTLACLSQAALANTGALRVLDFGGALGSSFHQARPYLLGAVPLEWHIVEQAHVVASGRKHFQTEQLQFHESLSECLASTNPHAVLLSAVLQYLPDPYALLQQLVATAVEFVIIDRHPITLTNELLTVQNIPASIYPASYPCWLFDPAGTSRILSAAFTPWAEWKGKDPPIYGRGNWRRIGARFVGQCWRRRKTP